jgi:hypothetical protein
MGYKHAPVSDEDNSHCIAPLVVKCRGRRVGERMIYYE